MSERAYLKRALRFLGWAVFLFVIALFRLQTDLQLALYLLFGWLLFLKSVTQTITVNWSMVFSAIGCLALLGVGSHLFLSWLYRSSDATEGQPRVWARRWTAAILSVLMLMFTAGISVVGATYQTIWLMTSPEPMIVERSRERSELHNAVYSLCQQAKDSKLTFEQIRLRAQALAAEYEHLHILLVNGPDQNPVALVAFHRDKRLQEKYGLYARHIEDDFGDREDISDFPRVREELQTLGLTVKMQKRKEEMEKYKAEHVRTRN